MNPGNLLDSRNGRFLTFGLLYVSEGIPYGFTSEAMVAFMRQQGVSLALIGTFVAALCLPWAFKWAWAPVIDPFKLHRLGGRKAWIVGCTAMMNVTLLVAATVDFKAHFQLLLAMVVLNNVFCATQDVGIDSLAVSTLQPEERGRGNGIMFAGQYLGIALGGGGAMFVPTSTMGCPTRDSQYGMFRYRTQESSRQRFSMRLIKTSKMAGWSIFIA